MIIYTFKVYGAGEAEKQFAVALKSLEGTGVKREQYVLSTKVFWGPNHGKDPVNLLIFVYKY